MLRALADVVAHCDVDHRGLLSDLRRPFATRQPVEVRVPLSGYRALLRRAITVTGDPALGLRCGLHASDAAFDLLAPLVAHVSTLREAIVEARRFQHLAFAGPDVHLMVGAGVARLDLSYPRALDATDVSIAEFLVAGVQRLLTAFGAAGADVHAVCFDHARPAHAHAYATAFDGKVCFRAPFTGIEFSASLLDRAHLHSNPALQSAVRRQAETVLRRIALEASAVDRLRTYLRNNANGGVPGMPTAARAVGLSERSLRRRLRDAGLSYRSLTASIQREQACALLRNPDVRVQAVADALGFSDMASFHRAFKRWTGLTTSAYRGRLQSHWPKWHPDGRTGCRTAS